MAKSPSLMRSFPTRLDIPLLILGTFVLFAVGINLPILEIRQLVFWKNEYTIITSVIILFEEGNYFLAGLIFFFSIVFPIIKLTALTCVWFLRIDNRLRVQALQWLEISGSWSMLDVFVVAVIVVVAKSSWLADASAQVGLYVFAGAILLSMVTTWMVKKLEGRMAPQQ